MCVWQGVGMANDEKAEAQKFDSTAEEHQKEAARWRYSALEIGKGAESLKRALDEKAKDGWEPVFFSNGTIVLRRDEGYEKSTAELMMESKF